MARVWEDVLAGVHQILERLDRLEEKVNARPASAQTASITPERAATLKRATQDATLKSMAAGSAEAGAGPAEQPGP